MITCQGLGHQHSNASQSEGLPLQHIALSAKCVLDQKLGCQAPKAVFLYTG